MAAAVAPARSVWPRCHVLAGASAPMRAQPMAATVAVAAAVVARLLGEEGGN